MSRPASLSCCCQRGAHACFLPSAFAWQPAQLPDQRPPAQPLYCHRYRLNYTQELRGLGLANLAGAMFNCYTTTGSFSRSAVNNSVG